MTPKQSNCMPPIIQIDATVEVQPPIVKPVYFRIMKTISAIKLTKNIKNPKQVIIRIGLILKEVIPSNANANLRDIWILRRIFYLFHILQLLI